MTFCCRAAFLAQRVGEGGGEAISLRSRPLILLLTPGSNWSNWSLFDWRGMPPLSPSPLAGPKTFPPRLLDFSHLFFPEGGGYRDKGGPFLLLSNYRPKIYCKAREGKAKKLLMAPSDVSSNRNFLSFWCRRLSLASHRKPPLPNIAHFFHFPFLLLLRGKS